MKAALAHLNLVMIHPFRDGNGRMARCLQTLVLAREGILAPELCSIEEYLGRNTHTYHEILARVGEGTWSPGNDARPWVRYCIEAHYVQAASVLRRIRESERFWTELEELVTAAGVPDRSIEALFDSSLGLQVRNVSYRSNVARNWGEISNQTATNDLRQLVDAGLLSRHGAKRGTWYQAAAPIRELRDEAGRQRTPISTEGLFAPTTD